MSHALLLRLFLSPSFFSVHVALQYLMLYADNIGITYYLTRRLKELDTQELREVWGFICHLLVTRPSKSRALECFVVDISQRSTHIAMITLWLMQASLQDISSSPSSPSFQVCQRTLQRCHEIIFGDLPTPVSSPYSGLDLPFQARFSRRKVKTHVEPVLIGFGLMLAGTPAMPELTEIMGEVALQQGRADDGSDLKSVQTDNDDIVSGSGKTTRNDSGDDDDNGSDGKNEDDRIASSHIRSSNDLCAPHGPAVPKKQTIFKRRRTIVAAQTSPALVHLQNMHRSTLSEDPLDQLDPSQPARVASPYQSSPSIPTTQHPFRQSTLNFGDSLLQRYDLDSQAHLLRSHYYRSEVQFLITLEHISNRLLVVPKPARVSALRAELTALNHKLPAEVCMPMWCSSSDNPAPPNASQPHHKIVRIPPGESVVLNSAERAPYLLIIEILHDDLDFDPTKRSNKETLKRIVTKENERKGASRELIAFTRSPLSSKHNPLGDPVVGSENALGKESAEEAEASLVPVASATSSTSSLVGDGEEMDLVEQLYGVGESFRGPIDLTESIVLPPVLKNKELDMVAWSRTSSLPSSPNPEGILSLSSSPAFPPPTGGQFSTLPSTTQLPYPQPNSNSSSRILSLDDYSERMRTAAVMLSQLNANLIREAVTTLPSSDSTATLVSSSSPSGPLSWLSGSGWLGGPHHQTNSGPLHPSLAGRAGDSPATTRMRVQHAEAAAIRDRIMKEMIALEEERMERMREHREGEGIMRIGDVADNLKTAEDETIIKRELNKVDPSALIFSESWATKKSRIQHGSPYGHLANWDCVSVIVKTGGDLRQEQVAVQLIQQFEQIWQEEDCQCWVRYFQILITGASSGLVETITDAVSIHSIKKSEYARRLAEGRFGYVTLLDHFKSTYGDPSMAKFVRAQRNFAKSLAGYSIVTYLLQIKDRHNGNILLDREGHLIHIDFGFMLSNSPGNIGFEAAPFKLPPEYVEVLGGVDGESFLEFKRLFREGFEAARKHCDRIITLVELMQKDSKLPCFAAFGEQTAAQLRDRFQPALTHSLVGEYIDRLIDTSLGSNWTRLYDSYQYYSQSIL